MLNPPFKVNELQWDETTSIIRVWSTKATQMYNLWWMYCTRQKINPQIFPSLDLAWADKHICQTPMYLHLFFLGRQIFWAPTWEARGRCWFSTADKAVRGQSGHGGRDLVCWSAINHAMQNEWNKKMKIMQKAPTPCPKVFLKEFAEESDPLSKFFFFFLKQFSNLHCSELSLCRHQKSTMSLLELKMVWWGFTDMWC